MKKHSAYTNFSEDDDEDELSAGQSFGQVPAKAVNHSSTNLQRSADVATPVNSRWTGQELAALGSIPRPSNSMNRTSESRAQTFRSQDQSSESRAQTFRSQDQSSESRAQNFRSHDQSSESRARNIRSRTNISTEDSNESSKNHGHRVHNDDDPRVARPPRRRKHVRQGSVDSDKRLSTSDSNVENDKFDRVSKNSMSRQRKSRPTSMQKHRPSEPETEQTDAPSSREEGSDLGSSIFNMNSLGHWTEEDEKELRSGRAEEQSLWLHLAATFPDDDSINCPVDLLPKGYDIDGTCFVEGSSMNLTKNFSDSLASLIRCPIFRKRHDLLRYAIQYAMYYRLRNEGFPEPEDFCTALSTSRNQRIGQALGHKISARLAQIMVEEEGFAVLHGEAVDEILGEDIPEHGDFIKVAGMKKIISEKGATRGRHTEPGYGVALKDLRAVISTWDVYAEMNRPDLWTIEEYNRKSPRSFDPSDRSRKEQYLNSKKAWILHQRQEKRSGERATKTRKFDEYRAAGSKNPESGRGKRLRTESLAHRGESSHANRQNAAVTTKEVTPADYTRSSRRVEERQARKDFDYRPSELNIFDYSRSVDCTFPEWPEIDSDSDITPESFGNIEIQGGKAWEDSAKKFLGRERRS
ncbi:hypothetical protein BELL_0164g00110 [Botrytis elliptica]|uniref:Uncharacterized protein n=1 Tax=Botrytis elliptica TaxID=278938 RepID=A0A4Z1JYD8_9HELO|nr:hypothetical protein EAE99_009459 [Botrytis elliptica]TGO76282.1 hypothetical protein BELL_0164g00110 [Botrytis elliptica]